MTRCLICGHVGLHPCLDVERADWMRSPGRTANLRIGPFTFGADTSDGGRVGFSIEIGRWGLTCQLGTTA